MELGEEDMVENNNSSKFNSLNKYSPLTNNLKPVQDSLLSVTTNSPSPFHSLGVVDQSLHTPPTLSTTGLLHPTVSNISFSHSLR